MGQGCACERSYDADSAGREKCLDHAAFEYQERDRRPSKDRELPALLKRDGQLDGGPEDRPDGGGASAIEERARALVGAQALESAAAEQNE